MAPERSPKRQKTSDSVRDATRAPQPAQIPLPPDESASETSGKDGSAPDSMQASSWYASWSRKAPPVTQVARESIKAASDATTEAISKVPSSMKPKSIRSPSLAMTLGKKQSNRALPADATPTLVHITSGGSNSSRKDITKTDLFNESGPGSVKKEEPASQLTEDKATGTAADSTKIGKSDAKDEAKELGQDTAGVSRAGWLGWLGASEAAQAIDADKKTESVPPPPSPPPPQQDGQPKTQSMPETIQAATDSPEMEASTVRRGKTVRRSWLPWGVEENEQSTSTTVPALEEAIPKDLVSKQDPEVAQQTQQNPSKPPSIETSAPPNLPHDTNKASAWAFWSRDRSVTGSTASVDKPHKGEMAISDTPSQAKPEKASITLKGSDKKPSDQLKLESKSEENLAKTAETSSIKQHKKTNSTTTRVESSNATAVAQDPVEDKKPASIRTSKNYKNLLLPEFHNTLKLPDNPSIIQQLARLLHITKEPELQHLLLVKDPPRIKNALAIGVHGFFPAPLLRTVLGQPTGTSIKFADMAAKSIKRWTAARGYECQVKTAALEGEGKIAERLDLLWKLLINWIDEINKADFVLVACHSQGVPVAIMLVAKLIQFGCITSAKIGICAMAGVNMGPFPEYKSRWIGGSAGELFEFSHPTSRVSTDYQAALETVLKFGVCVTFVGSIDDQLVSLDSSIFSPMSHPHIYRAVSIDAKVHAPNFLSHLVGFALKLRNLGVQDHGLIRELSPHLAGSLYTGEGHSRIYEDDAVYDLAVAFTLETNSMAGVPMIQRSVAAGAGNPFILPFAMRGILEEDFVKNELQGEASELLQQFDEWKPITKGLKDVKFRLEGIRSKL